MWDSDRSWKKAGEFKKEVRALKLKKENESVLKDNIQMHYNGLGRLEAKTKWSKNGNKKTIPKLQDRFIDIIKLTKKWHVLDEPPTIAPQGIEISIVGKLSNAVNDLYRQEKAKDKCFNRDSGKEWQQREDIGETRVLEKIQQRGNLNIDDSFISTRIEN